MARKYEGSAEDEAEDTRGAKAMGVSKAKYEASPRDKREDAAGEDRIMVKAHHRARRQAPPPPAQSLLAQAPGEANEPDLGGM